MDAVNPSINIEELIIFLVGLIPVALGLIPATIAYRKGRSFLLWWLYGFLLFIVAFPHAVLIKIDVSKVIGELESEGSGQIALSKYRRGLIVAAVLLLINALLWLSEVVLPHLRKGVWPAIVFFIVGLGLVIKGNGLLGVNRNYWRLLALCVVVITTLLSLIPGVLAEQFLPIKCAGEIILAIGLLLILLGKKSPSWGRIFSGIVLVLIAWVTVFIGISLSTLPYASTRLSRMEQSNLKTLTNKIVVQLPRQDRTKFLFLHAKPQQSLTDKEVSEITQLNKAAMKLLTQSEWETFKMLTVKAKGKQAFVVDK